MKIFIPTELEDHILEYTVNNILKYGAEPVFPDAKVFGEHHYLRACAHALSDEIVRLRTEAKPELFDKGYFVLNHSRLYESEEAAREIFSESWRRSGYEKPDYIFPLSGNGLTILMWNEFREKHGSKIIAVEPLSSGLLHMMKEFDTKDVYNLTGRGSLFELTGLDSGSVLTTIPGTNPGGTATGKSVKMPFLNTAMFGGRLYGIGFNDAMVKEDSDAMKKNAREDSRIYSPCIDDVMLFADEKMLRRYENMGADSARIAENIKRSKDMVLYDDILRTMHENSLDVGPSSAAGVASMIRYINANKISGKTFMGIFYDSMDKYRL